ncbi:Gfo/Idh/MocA family protein [Rothia kristinae]|uniref:Gfo/Idh/MocA family protein n=1 Tax=Rothia kristinae TaxID=37923 RepID=UPI0022E020F0|nr:Gfo/Idh/MocA family oxidoreductase [Rothia kristinae]
MNTETARAAAEPGAPDPRASDPRTATGRTLGWGIVSTGAIARKVTPEIALLADARLVGVSSRSEEPARAFAEGFGVARAYGGPDGMGRMLADPEVQVVYIATPHGQHHEHIRAALEAGKHVVCEKALTITAAQARDVVELARERGLFLMEGLWTRFLPIRARIAEVLAAGEIGAPRWAQVDLGFRGPADVEHRLWREDAGGGALLDMGCYGLHWPWLAFGEPTGFTASAIRRGAVDALTSITAAFDHAPGGAATAQITLSLVSQGPRRAVISGQEGVLEVGSPMHRPASFTVTDASGAVREERVETVGRGYGYEMREATRCIQQGLTESPVMPWADSVRQMAWLDAIREQIGVRYPGLE